MKRYLPLCLLLTLCLTACTPQAAPVETTAPSPEEPRALTQKEIDQVNEAFSPQVERDDGTSPAPVNGFFASYYDDVKGLDFAAFLEYYPDDGTLSAEDEAESDALKALPGYPWGVSPGSVPTHRFLRASVDETLERYAGITTADLTSTDDVPYLEGYDAWYNFTSDFGSASFLCAGGQVDEAAGTALLWTDEWEDGSRRELVLEQDGEGWHIRSFRIDPSTGKE